MYACPCNIFLNWCLAFRKLKHVFFSFVPIAFYYTKYIVSNIHLSWRATHFHSYLLFSCCFSYTWWEGETFLLCLRTELLLVISHNQLPPPDLYCLWDGRFPVQDPSREDRGNRSLLLCGHSDVVGCRLRDLCLLLAHPHLGWWGRGYRWLLGFLGNSLHDWGFGGLY